MKRSEFIGLLFSPLLKPLLPKEPDIQEEPAVASKDDHELDGMRYLIDRNLGAIESEFAEDAWNNVFWAHWKESK